MASSSDLTFTAKSALSATRSIGENIKIIDVSEKPTKANVVREGRQVPSITLDPQIVGEIIRPGVIIQPGEAPRVVSQSIAAGTKVARGTSVDLVLAPRRTIPIDVIVGRHADFSGRNMADVADSVFTNRQVLTAVLDFEAADQVPAATRTVIQQQLQQSDIGIDDANPDRSFAAAFNTLKGVAAFK